MPNLRAAGVAVATATILFLPLATAATPPAPDAGSDTRLGHALHRIVERGKVPDDLWIETLDGERPDPPEMIVYGSGVGVWAGTRQFQTSQKHVLKALRLLDRAGFADMPERVRGPKPEHVEAGGEPDSTMIVRSITLSIGGLTKTVVQDNKAWKLESFERLRAKLVKAFRKDARHGVEASSLDDGLAKVASGVLAPVTLRVMVNAPEQRGLASQEGQGWLLRIQHGRVEVQPHSLTTGYGEWVSRRLNSARAREVAGWLREAGFPEMPPNVYAPGYTDLSVAVLGREKTIQARRFAGRDPAAEAARTKRFLALKELFGDFAMKLLNR